MTLIFLCPCGAIGTAASPRAARAIPKAGRAGIPNPKRRLLDFRAWPTSVAVLMRLVERKPYLLRRFATQILPPRAPRR